MKLNKKTYFYLALGSVFILAVILRFWKVAELFYFGIDEEYQAHLAWSIVKDFHIIWIGLSAANTGFYVGPGFTYLNALLFWMSKGDPLILGYFSALLGCITLAVFYLITTEVFNKRVAVITTALYGLSQFVVLYDRRFWNSTFVPFIVIVMFYSLVKAQKNSWWYLLTIFLVATSFHIHASLFLLTPMVLFVFAKKFQEKKYRPNIRLVALSLTIFIAILSPLIVFEFIHNFDNVKTPLRMLHSANQGSKFSLTQHVTLFVETLGSSISMKASTALRWILGTMILGLMGFFFSKKRSANATILRYFLITYGVGLLLYPGLVLEYYFLGFLPFVFLTIALTVEKLPTWILTIAIIIFATVNSFNIFQLPTNGGLAAKKNLVIKTSGYLQEKNFYLDTHEPYLYFGGWKYLFDIYGKKPAKSKADDMFGWIYQKEIVEKTTQTRVLITELDIIPKGKVIHKISSGPFKSYIFIENDK